MEVKLFYNPIWMPTEEMIFLWCCMVPEIVEITDVDNFELYLDRHYKNLAASAFAEHGNDIYKWYHDFIDENYWHNDPDTLIDCLLQSDKYRQQKYQLSKRVKANVMPEFVIGSTEAQSIYEDFNLYYLFYNYDSLFTL